MIFISVLCLGIAGIALSIDRQSYQQIVFEAEHTNDPAVKQALQTLISKGILRAEAGGTSRVSQVSADCQVLVGEGLVRSALMRDFLKKELPKEILELNLRFDASSIGINGRLDGPLFINPRFESRIEFAFLKENSFRMNIIGLKVMGFELTVFSRLLKKYVDDALKRVFIKGCTTRATDGADGSVAIDVTINPEGFVPGIGQKAVLSGFEMSGRMLRFSFTLTK
ncbi:MAG TPA: hypothetical protein PLU72_11435 [Candidatus Ozemobacteraceae bacterium]|nr:hypothetical protein [Candidatus Ozemobacteraceae bacterium]HQG28910.1 hypothetical protein [Candidatus Ozemobacteraceae bacterium]